MKTLFTIILIAIGSFCYGQVTAPIVSRTISGETIYISRIEVNHYKDGDSLTAERFIEDSIGNEYEIQYKFINSTVWHDSTMNHVHVISLVSIIQFHGNKQKTIFSNIKAIYSTTECQSDNRELWLKRLYEYLNSKK